MKLTRTRVMAVILGIVGVGVFAPVAVGSPPSGFTATPLVIANFDDTAHVRSDGIKFQTKGRTDVLVQKIVIDPGGSSGWHHHPGMVIIAVQSGSVTLWDSRCHQTNYGPGLPNGAAFTESGDRPVRVTSAGGATTYATFVAPSADPPVFRIDDNPPRCAP